MTKNTEQLVNQTYKPTVMEIVELAEEIEAAGLGQIDLVRAALARWGHHPAPPAGELLKEAAWLRNECSAENADGNWISMSIDQALDLASLLERQAAPAPVPVAERLPGPENCDAEGRCWVGYPELTYSIADTGDTDTTTPEWRLEHQPLKPKGSRCCWLPAHALPLPQGEVE